MSKYIPFNRWLLFLVFVVSSCNQKRNQVVDDAIRPGVTSGVKPLPAHPPVRHIMVEDLLPVRGDTLLAVGLGGLSLTTDAGRHWKSLSERAFFKYLTIDQRRVLWGLDSWPGVHEPAYSRLSYSTDFGVTWTTQEFNTYSFFPYEIYSQPGHPLQILTLGKKVYQVKDQVGKQWEFIRTISELVYDTLPEVSYFSGGHYKFLETGQLFSRAARKWQPVATVGFINDVHDVCSCQGNVYLTGRNRASGSDTSLVVRLASGQVQDTIPTQGIALQLRCDSKGRLWLFNHGGIWLKSGNTLVKQY